MNKKFFENEDKIDDDDVLDIQFLNLEDSREINIKFHQVKEDLDSKQIIKDIKDEKTILFIDLKEIVEDTASLRIFVSKIKRISDTMPVTMRLYGGTWLIILPKNVNFYVGEE